MDVRVVSDQPWDVAADVLAVPFVGKPALDGALGELNRRSGGSLEALVTFGELKGDRYGTTLVAAGSASVSGGIRAGMLLLVGAGEPETLNRQVVVRVGSAIERRLAGRPVKSLAVWLGDLPPEAWWRAPSSPPRSTATTTTPLRPRSTS
jgi:hypothetical protein